VSLVGLVVDVHRRLSEESLPHAFGGALALAYVAEPRGTVDVDVNVFRPANEIGTILTVLAGIGLQPEREEGNWLPAAGIRVRRSADPYPVDVFPSLDERYAEIEQRRQRHRFGDGGVVLPFLSAEDLALFKLSFGRDKDWMDLRAMATARPDLDVEYVERQLIGLRGPAMYPRLARLRSLLRAAQERAPRPGSPPVLGGRRRRCGPPPTTT